MLESEAQYKDGSQQCQTTCWPKRAAKKMDDANASKYTSANTLEANIQITVRRLSVVDRDDGIYGGSANH